ncbi:gliding motility lipoprotein GldB [Winogradskyella sp. DF17]|uniref:Gliding motility lipoprotein GldB n=1 Tax=Winogradskyella pelagia TaxID=2819984 RepID=A0ABS3T3L4_9FLAO|nr:gliding motility lipoprotein GldB [Winogradskyella sp. DF17]MBO3117049.1 gliding motility lipoprotein GldB [Winogradskyella sp. DF17]
MLWRIYLVLIAALFFWSCNDDNQLEDEISKIDIDVVIERFDKAIEQAEPQDLYRLQAAYPFLFSKRIPDSVWVKRITDTLQDALLSEVVSAFRDFSQVEVDIKRLFQHFKYYDKTFRVPRVIALTNDVAYRDKTIVTDTIVLVALDNYLGKDHKFYQNIPRYITANMQPKNIVPDIAEGFAVNYVFQSQKRTFLDEMIYQGKLLYFKDVMTPFISDHEKIGYTQEQLNWAEANESAIWSYFVERELLYSTDSKLVNRFIVDAPFSKFYLELDNESPGRVGQYIGWQIVRAYAMRTEEDVLTILQKEPQEIFNKSKFKPRK